MNKTKQVFGRKGITIFYQKSSGFQLFPKEEMIVLTVNDKQVKITKNQELLETKEIDGITYNIWQIQANSDGKSLQAKVKIPALEEIGNMEETTIKAIYDHAVSDILTDGKNYLRSQIKSDEELIAKKRKLEEEMEKINSLLEE